MSIPPRSVDCLVSRVPRAELRVYSPLASFPPPERAKWEIYAAGTKGRGVRGIVGGDVRSGVEGAPPERKRRTAPDLRHESKAPVAASFERLLDQARRDDGGAYVRHDGGRVLICPRRFELRSLFGLLAVRRALNPSLTEALLPGPRAENVARELDRLRAQHPERRVHIRSSAWQVPAHWFAAFDGGERSYDVDAGGRSGVVYVVAASVASERLAEAARIVDAAGLGIAVSGNLSALSAWVGGFPDGSLAEIDYGTVADLFSAEALADDHSARDVRAALEALQRGDVLRSGSFYAVLTGRWAAARAAEGLS